MFGVVMFVSGLFIGAAVIHLVYTRASVAGTLKIDHSNPEKDVYRFDIDDLDSLSKKDRITLIVDNKADLSQK